MHLDMSKRNNNKRKAESVAKEEKNKRDSIPLIFLVVFIDGVS
jgi:hypothetical protein